MKTFILSFLLFLFPLFLYSQEIKEQISNDITITKTVTENKTYSKNIVITYKTKNIALGSIEITLTPTAVASLISKNGLNFSEEVLNKISDYVRRIVSERFKELEALISDIDESTMTATQFKTAVTDIKASRADYTITTNKDNVKKLP